MLWTISLWLLPALQFMFVTNIWEEYLTNLETLEIRASTEEVNEGTSRSNQQSSMVAAATLASKN